MHKTAACSLPPLGEDFTQKPAKRGSANWLQTNFIQGLGGGFLERLLIHIGSFFENIALRLHKKGETLRLISQTRRERKWLLTSNEAFLVHSLARSQSRLPGAMAEVGVFQGGSARMICEAKGQAKLHLFDTFAGLPAASRHDTAAHQTKPHLYACSLASVRAYLSGFPNVSYHQGLFPHSAEEVPESERFSFAHLDVDLYESTLRCLEYFYPRMASGGIILSHDYSILEGVRRAFSEYLQDKPEELIELPSTQCMVVKL